MIWVLIALLLVAGSGVVAIVHLGPIIQSQQSQILAELIRLRVMYEESMRLSKEAAASVARVRRKMLGAEDEN